MSRLGEHRDDIIRALRLRDGEQIKLRHEAEAWAAIEWAVASALQRAEWHTAISIRDKTGVSRRDLYVRLRKSLGTALKDVHRLAGDAYLLEPLRWSREELDPATDVADLAGRMAAVEAWTADALVEASGSVSQGQPLSPEALTLSDVTYSLALVYRDQTGDLPGHSKGYETPFERFVVAVAQAIPLEVGDSSETGRASKVSSAVARFHKQTLKVARAEPDHVFWEDLRELNQPAPRISKSGQEVFGETVAAIERERTRAQLDRAIAEFTAAHPEDAGIDPLSPEICGDTQCND
jgi:hypothetical protein